MEQTTSHSRHPRLRPEELQEDVLLDISRNDSIETLPDTPAELLSLKKSKRGNAEKFLAEWESIARGPHRAYLGVGLALFGTCCGGLVFPLMDMYEENPMLKVGTRNLVLTLLCAVALQQQSNIGIPLGDVNQILKHFTDENNKQLITTLLLAGITHGVVSIMAQLALDYAGDEVTAVLTNCSCLFTVMFSLIQDKQKHDQIVKYSLYIALTVVTYFIIVLGPSVYGVLAGLAVSCVNAAHLMFVKTLRNYIPLVPLMGMMYAQSTVFLLLNSFYFNPELSIGTWLFAMINPWYSVPTFLVALLTACFQGSIVLALSFSTPIVVTGIMSFEPIATLVFDLSLGRPVPNWHTLLVLFLFMTCTAVISLRNSGIKKKKIPI